MDQAASGRSRSSQTRLNQRGPPNNSATSASRPPPQSCSPRQGRAPTRSQALAVTNQPPQPPTGAVYRSLPLAPRCGQTIHPSQQASSRRSLSERSRETPREPHGRSDRGAIVGLRKRSTESPARAEPHSPFRVHAIVVEVLAGGDPGTIAFLVRTQRGSRAPWRHRDRPEVAPRRAPAPASWPRNSQAGRRIEWITSRTTQSSDDKLSGTLKAEAPLWRGSGHVNDLHGTSRDPSRDACMTLYS